MEAYQVLKEIGGFKIIQIKNKLDTLNHISVKVIYAYDIIVEVQIGFGRKTPAYYAKHFIYELTRCDSHH